MAKKKKGGNKNEWKFTDIVTIFILFLVGYLFYLMFLPEEGSVYAAEVNSKTIISELPEYARFSNTELPKWVKKPYRGLRSRLNINNN